MTEYKTKRETYVGTSSRVTEMLTLASFLNILFSLLSEPRRLVAGRIFQLNSGITGMSRMWFDVKYSHNTVVFAVNFQRYKICIPLGTLFTFCLNVSHINYLPASSVGQPPHTHTLNRPVYFLQYSAYGYLKSLVIK
jgi:hypothetical protein